MDIKTLFYLAKFAHDYEDFKRSFDKSFEVKDDPSYQLSIEGVVRQPQINPPLPSEAYTFTPEIQGPLPSYDYWMDVRIDKLDTKEKES